MELSMEFCSDTILENKLQFRLSSLQDSAVVDSACSGLHTDTVGGDMDVRANVIVSSSAEMRYIITN